MSPQNYAARPPQPPPPPQHLKISRDSHTIHKSSSSPSSSSNSSNNFGPNIRHQHYQQQQHIKSPQTSNSNNNNNNNQNLQQRHHPVIIYTHSPKVIHITPRDFLSLVQKLTGLARSEGEAAAGQQINSNESPSDVNNSKNSNAGKIVGHHHDTSPSSVITHHDENSHNHHHHQVMMMNLSSSMSNHHVWDQHLPPTHYTPSSDIPIYAPNPDFFCSSKPIYRYHPDSSVFINSSNINGTSISPSLLHVIKGTGLPHY